MCASLERNRSLTKVNPPRSSNVYETSSDHFTVIEFDSSEMKSSFLDEKEIAKPKKRTIAS
jgi:hypothetical protein